MRTTVRLNDQLLTDAKRFALERNQTLTDLIEQALRQTMQTPTSKSFKSLPTRALGKPKLKIDFSSNANIQELLDEGLDVRSRR
jgi:hypothetical protein